MNRHDQELDTKVDPNSVYQANVQLRSIRTVGTMSDSKVFHSDHIARKKKKLAGTKHA